MSKKESKKNVEKDMVMKIGPLHLYFENIYTLISLGNDLATGILYLIGSVANLLGWPSIIGNSLFVIGGFSLFMRPLIKIFHRIHIYNERRLKENFKKSELKELLDEDKPINVKKTDDIFREEEDSE